MNIILRVAGFEHNAGPAQCGWTGIEPDGTLVRGLEFSIKNGFRVDRRKASELIVGVIETEIGGARTLKTNLAL
jgi:hypothetical protein